MPDGELPELLAQLVGDAPGVGLHLGAVLGERVHPPLTATLEATPAAPRTATIGPIPGVRARSALVSNSSARRGPWVVCSATWARALTSLWPAPNPIIVRRIRLPSSMERNWPVMASVPGGAI